jgi:hypothetical protein
MPSQPLDLKLDAPGFAAAAEVFEDVPATWASSPVLRAGWGNVHTLMLHHCERMFETEGVESMHGRWQNYQPQEMDYFAYKSAKLGAEADHILQWGKMKKRLGPSLFDASHKDHIWKVAQDGKSAEFGTKVPYAKKHQEGTNQIPARWGGGMSPQRRVIDPTERDKQNVRATMWKAIWDSWDSSMRRAWRSARQHRIGP